MSQESKDRGEVVVVGSANVDLIAQTERLPAPGETVLGGEFVQTLGGKGANQAVAAARSGASVRFIGALGADAYGDACLDAYGREGIDTSLVKRHPSSPTGVALITVDSGGENCIVVAPGANTAVNREFIEASVPDTCDVLVCQLETPLGGVESAFKGARRRGAVTILNPAPAQPLAPDLLSAVNCMTPNESETEMLTGIRPDSNESAATAGQMLLKRGVDTAIITMGADGAVLVDEAGWVHQQAPTVSVVDTTGAGDTFTGCLAARYAWGESFRDALPYACYAASLAVTQNGAQPSIPFKEAILEQMG